VQIAAGVLHSARRWLPERHTISEHGLLMAGGAAGIAAAFNTPLGGVMFAIEELWRRREQRSSALLISAIVLAGLMAVSIYGNNSYFGRILVTQLGWSLFWPGLLIAVSCGLLGGLFSRLLILSMAGGSDLFSRQRKRAPVRFAAGCALLVAVIGVVTHGATFGSGYEQTRGLLEGDRTGETFYTPLKFIATWLTSWSGVPAGIFAPSLAVGAGVGSDIASITGFVERPALIALGMAGFLAAVTQAPLTSLHHRDGDGGRSADGAQPDGLRAGRQRHLAADHRAAVCGADPAAADGPGHRAAGRKKGSPLEGLRKGRFCPPRPRGVFEAEPVYLIKCDAAENFFTPRAHTAAFGVG
jgi:H+/Cl- antiporter ClcA